MISLRKITLDNRREVFKLKVTEDQSHFVASNLSSVASCYVYVPMEEVLIRLLFMQMKR